MFAIYACTLLIVASSLILGRALLTLLRWPRPLWLAAASGFAALVILAPFLIRLPGRGTTAAVLIALLVVAAAAYSYRRRAGVRDRAWRREALVGLAAALLVLGLASLPFLFNERVGILGEGIYTNDHAAQLYWADWLQHAFGPQPSAVRFGYPIGPQALAAVVSSATTIDLVAAFNGLLLAIPVLSALTALAALATLSVPARITVAVLTGLTYLAASFLAQSAFKETAMALFVLAFALTTATLSGRQRERAGGPSRTAVLAVGLILIAASVFTFSLPGLAWFALALPLWLILEALAGSSPIDWHAVADSISRHRRPLAIATAVALATVVVAIGPAVSFIDKIGDVQASQGRLSSPIFPGEAFGIWPAGDYRLVRGEVSGSLIATALGLLAAAYGVWVLARRRQYALLAMLGAGLIVYVAARLFAEIHVEAKALAVISPLVVLIALRGLLEPAERDRDAAPASPLATRIRYPLGALLALALLGSSVLALRAAPVGFDGRGEALERLAERVKGESVVFIGLDRFAGYWLRETLMRAPAGYVPQEIDNRPEKRWQQGDAVDFDNLDAGKLDKFRYAITPAAAYASAAPKNFEPIASDGDYVLWRRQGETPKSLVVAGEAGAAGVDKACISGAGGPPTVKSTVFPTVPALGDPGDWKGAGRVETAIAGQESAFEAPARLTNSLQLPRPGAYELSLQYHSQVPLTVSVGGEEIAELPPSLEGFYLDGAGEGAFWPAGRFEDDGGRAEVEIRAAKPGGLQEALGVDAPFLARHGRRNRRR